MKTFNDLKFKGKYSRKELKYIPQGYIAKLFFDNGYGVSVVYGHGAYGSKEKPYEIAVLKGSKKEGWDICYDTEITNNVIGYLTEEEVTEKMIEIQNLK